ncbi:hypothetical protein [Streptomyces bobili]
MADEQKKIIKIHLEPSQDGVTLCAVGAASATAPDDCSQVLEQTTITEATVIEIQV